MYDGAPMPSAQENINGPPSAAVAISGSYTGPGGSVLVADPAADPRPEEEMGPEVEDKEPSPEPVLVKRAHREILDHERKRRVELKCMELQEMMEEQGYSEEEIRQKVGTFRQMLMEKEGVITREGAHTRPPVKYMSHEEHGEEQTDHALAEGYHKDEDWQADYYDKDTYSPAHLLNQRQLTVMQGEEEIQQLSITPAEEEEEEEIRPPEKSV
ncbi:hypothetical protein DPEC_G00228170 [Dallia pectoralis]|uniref:Uncharacterized protein n=1 Tax=Dallia pectoralis TaxID=75939 RepID=A0ACC2G1G3_DALPE|nr:hypothetical protein DPEC_G00228170 [Dallia pectoralis]